MQSTLGAAPNVHLPEEEEKCPFCNDKTHNGYRTVHGKMKDEGVLRTNLKSVGTITRDLRVGTIYPFSAAGDNFQHWQAEERVFEEHATRIAAAPHHIIPGDAVMSKVAALESWTTESKGSKIKEDIGYNIDGAKNGIFLPRYPDIFGTKRDFPKTESDGSVTKVTGPEYYGRGTWSELDPDEKKAIAYYIMCETGLQLHQTSHGAKYISDPNKNYNKEAKDACVNLAGFIKLKQMACPVDGQKDKPYDPPYGVVSLINTESDNIRKRMSGCRISNWTTWCTRISEQLTIDIKSKKVKETMSFKIRKVY
ncbi:MAG: hypothetical protein ACNYZG_05735 [Gammaproteobacteria bacterium]